MKNLKAYAVIIVLAISFASCSSDDDTTPEIINEEELITTLIATFTDPATNEVITLQSQDLDGDNGDEPTLTVSGNFNGNTTYEGTVQFLNELEDEDITEEVEEESDEHQVFFTFSSDLDASITHTNFDGNNNPLGTTADLVAGEASTGTLTITLRHQPIKPNDGTLVSAGGDTDIQAIFDVVIEE